MYLSNSIATAESVAERSIVDSSCQTVKLLCKNSNRDVERGLE